MKLIHVTQTTNVDSILYHGIIPSIPKLIQWEHAGKEEEWYDEKLGFVFTFPEHDQRDRFIRDLMYWKCWGDPRNDHIGEDVLPDNIWEEVRNIGPEYFKYIRPKGNHFTVFELEDFDWDKSLCRLHQQSYDMNPIWNDMDQRFEHNDKTIYAFNKTIESKYIKVIGEATIEFNRREKANIRLKV